MHFVVIYAYETIITVGIQTYCLSRNFKSYMVKAFLCKLWVCGSGSTDPFYISKSIMALCIDGFGFVDGYIAFIILFHNLKYYYFISL